MSTYKEIVTKAVIGKGKKTYRKKYVIDTDNTPNTVLGCWVINHGFTATLDQDCVVINGDFEINIWYAYDEDSNTELHKEKISYSELVPFKMKKGEELTFKQELKAYCTNYPSCTELKIKDEKLYLKIKKDFIVDAIGEAVIKVQLSDLTVDNLDLEEEIEENVDTNYLNKDN